MDFYSSVGEITLKTKEKLVSGLLFSDEGYYKVISVMEVSRHSRYHSIKGVTSHVLKHEDKGGTYGTQPIKMTSYFCQTLLTKKPRNIKV